MQRVANALVGLVVMFGCVALAQEATRAGSAAGTASTQFVGPWSLTWLEVPASDGSMTRVTSAKGFLVYMADGRMAVQVMPADAAGSHEAVFGRFTVNPASKALTHHVEGSNNRALLGQAIRLVYQLEGRRLTVRSADPAQKWSAVWERN